MSEHYQPIFAKLQNLTGSNGEWKATCPAHDDQTASLALTLGEDGKLLVHCHAGCTFAAIAAAIGEPETAFFPPKPAAGPAPRKIAATYGYRDENGLLLFQVVRYSPKDFRVRRPAGGGRWTWNIGDVRRVLFGLPEILAADPKRAVFVVEGEKDVLTARSLGIIATTNQGGASAWTPKNQPSGVDVLRERHVIIIPDNDDPGRKHAVEVANALHGLAASVRIIELPGLPEHGDLTDWVQAGGTIEKLRALVSAKDSPVPAPVSQSAPATAPAAPARQPGRLEAAVTMLRHARQLGESAAKMLTELQEQLEVLANGQSA